MILCFQIVSPYLYDGTCNEYFCNLVKACVINLQFDKPLPIFFFKFWSFSKPLMLLILLTTVIGLQLLGI